MWGLAFFNVALKIFGLSAKKNLMKQAEKLWQQQYDAEIQSAENMESSGKVARDMYYADAAMMRMDADASALQYELQAGDAEKEGVAFAAEQRIGFVKNGVDMTGSPLIVSKETIKTAYEEASMLRQAAKNIQVMGGLKASQAETVGRAKFFEGMISASSTREAAMLNLKAKQLGLKEQNMNDAFNLFSSTASTFASMSGSSQGKTSNVDYTQSTIGDGSGMGSSSSLSTPNNYDERRNGGASYSDYYSQRSMFGDLSSVERSA